MALIQITCGSCGINNISFDIPLDAKVPSFTCGECNPPGSSDSQFQAFQFDDALENRVPEIDKELGMNRGRQRRVPPRPRCE